MHFTTSLFVGCDRTCGMNCGKLGRIGPAEKRPPCDDALGLSKSVPFLGERVGNEHDTSIPGMQDGNCREARKGLDFIRASGGRC